MSSDSTGTALKNTCKNFSRKIVIVYQQADYETIKMVYLVE